MSAADALAESQAALDFADEPTARVRRRTDVFTDVFDVYSLPNLGCSRRVFYVAPLSNVVGRMLRSELTYFPCQAS